MGVVHGELPTKATAGRNPRGLAQGRTLSSLRDWASEARRSTQICLPEQGMLTFRERKNWVIEGHNVSDRKDTKNEEGNGIPETRRAEHSREARNVKWTHRRSRKAKARNYSGPRLFHADRKQGLLDADGAESTSATTEPDTSEPPSHTTLSRPVFIHLPISSCRCAALRWNFPKFSPLK